MAEPRWKRHERRVARAFGSERALQEGRKGPDFETDFAIGSVKSKEKFPKWLMGAVDQVRGYALDGRLPVLCLVERGRRGFLVVIDSRDFTDHFGDLITDDSENGC